MSDDKKNDLPQFTESKILDGLAKLREMSDLHTVWIREGAGVHDSMPFDIEYCGAMTGRMSASWISTQNIPRAQPAQHWSHPINEGRELFRKTADSIYDTIQESSRSLRRRYGAEFVHRRTQAQNRIRDAYFKGDAEAGLQRVAKEQAALLLWLNEIMNERLK